MVPHGSVLYVLWRRPDRFAPAAARMYAVFDLGAVFYWAIPTAPPWCAARHGRLGVEPATVRRMMIEYGEEFWGDRWPALYDVLGGNPLAAMPSLHFATSLMGAHLLSEVGPVAGAVGWTYAALLGLALVYLGEHYAVDLLGGAVLAETVRNAERPTPLARRSPALLASLQRLAAEALGAARASRARSPPVPGTVGRRTKGRPASRTAHVAAPSRPGLRAEPRPRRCPACASRAGACSPRSSFVVSSGGVSVLGAAQAAGSARHVEPDPARQRLVAGAGRGARGVLVPRLHRAVPSRIRARGLADRLARELRDHHGRSGRDPAVRVSRRRRHRADGVGSASVGAWSRGSSPAG